MSASARVRRIVGIAALIAGCLMALAATGNLLHLFDTRAVRIFPAREAHPPLAVVYLSGDMGLRFGMGPKVAPALAAHGIPVLGVSSAVEFATRRTRADADAILAGAIRLALRRTGAARVVVMGQSFGADIAATAAPELPPELRARVAAILLVVPARTVYFRADPTGIAYRGAPDALPVPAMRRLGWAPVICIHGAAERDSLCPELSGSAARIVALPGGHFLRSDHRLLIATILGQLRAVVPELRR